MPTSDRSSPLTVLASLLSLSVGGCTQAQQPPPAARTAPEEGIRVSYRLDPRLADPTRNGNRWISPPTYVGANAQQRIEAMAQGVGPKGELLPIQPTWTPSDPEMVEVTPRRGSPVVIQVKHPGESTLKIEAPGRSTDLRVQAANVNGSMHVAVTQPQLKNVTPTEEPPLPPEVKRPTPEEVQAARERLLQSRAERIATFQMQKEETEGRVFQLNGGPDVVKLGSGLQYHVLTRGSGPKPTVKDRVRCRIRITDLDGKLLDSSNPHGQTVTLDVGADPGLAEALPMMNVGSRWQILVPARTVAREVPGRGKRRRGVASAFSIPLVYELELLGIQSGGGPGTVSDGRRMERTSL